MITQEEYIQIIADIPGMMKGLKESIDEKKIPPENVECRVAMNTRTGDSYIIAIDSLANDGTFLSFELSKDYSMYAKQFIADKLNKLFKELRNATAELN